MGFRGHLACGKLHSLDRNVDAAPPDIVLATVFVDDTLVLGTPSGLLAGKVDERTGRRQDGTFVHNGVLVQGGDGSVALDVDLVHVETGLRKVLDVLTEDYERRAVGTNEVSYRMLGAPGSDS